MALWISSCFIHHWGVCLGCVLVYALFGDLDVHACPVLACTDKLDACVDVCRGCTMDSS